MLTELTLRSENSGPPLDPNASPKRVESLEELHAEMSLAVTEVHACSEPQTEGVWGVKWTATESVVSVSADGSIRQWSSDNGTPHPADVNKPPPHTLGLISLSVSPDGQRALYNSLEGTTAMMDLSNGEIVGKFESYVRSSEGAEPSWSVSLNPKGETYASSGSSGNVTIHSSQPNNFGERLSTLTSGRTKFGMCCSHSPDGSRVALSSESGQIFIFDLETGSLGATYTSHAMAVRTMSWSWDNGYLLSGSDDKRLILHDVRAPTKAAGGAAATFTGHSSWVLSSDVSPDGRLALSGSADKTIKVWDIAARAAVSTISETGEVWSLSWRPKPSEHGKGAGFVSGGEDGVVRWRRVL
ncbi:WD40/YVTN repeat-like-containing domain superfamily protein [Pleurotus pulmonarius]